MSWVGAREDQVFTWGLELPEMLMLMVLEPERRILRGEAGWLGWEAPLPTACVAGISEALFLGTARSQHPDGDLTHYKIL